MTPPAGPGQARVLKTHYERVGLGPVAYVDETYHVEADGRPRFYVMSAVVVLESDRDGLRNELDTLVPDGWWHTTNELRSDDGRERTQELLRSFRVPDETCVVVDKVALDDDDLDGMRARSQVLGRLLVAVHTAQHGSHPPVNLIVLEEQRVLRINNFDRSVRAQLVADESVAASMELAIVSPGVEHLLWLPDLVCSAYRQQLVFKRAELFEEIEHLTHVVHLP